MNEKYKIPRIVFGSFIAIAATVMWFYAADRPGVSLPVWAVPFGWLLGGGIAFSTVVRSLAREFLPFFNRRGGLRGPITDGTQVRAAMSLSSGRRKTDQDKEVSK